MRVVADQVGLDQTMCDPRVLGRPAAGGGEDLADEVLEPVMRDDQGEPPLSCEQVVNDPAGDVGQPHVAAAMEVSQEPMVEAQKVQDRGVQIVNVDLVLDGRVSEVIGRAVGLAPLDSAAGHPGCETARAMVATLAVLAGGRPAEFAGPHDQGLVQQPSPLEVEQQARHRLIGLAAVELVVLVDVGVGVPVLVVVAAAGIDLHKANPALDEPARHQAPSAEPLGPGVVEPVQPLRLGRFAREVDSLGSAGLHAIGQLVAGDAGRQLGIIDVGPGRPRPSFARRSSWLRCCAAEVPSGGSRFKIGSPLVRNWVPW